MQLLPVLKIGWFNGWLALLLLVVTEGTFFLIRGSPHRTGFAWLGLGVNQLQEYSAGQTGDPRLLSYIPLSSDCHDYTGAPGCQVI